MMQILEKPTQFQPGRSAPIKNKFLQHPCGFAEDNSSYGEISPFCAKIGNQRRNSFKDVISSNILSGFIFE